MSVFSNRPKVLLIVVFLLLVGIGWWVVSRSFSGKASAPPIVSPASQAPNISPEGILQSQPVNKEINIPIEKGGQNLIYTIETAELRKQILVKGQTQTAVNGRLFLIFNLKLTNNLNKGLNINTRDYVRLSVNGATEKLAPDIHNDPVEVQAISTKYTRLGFPINDTDKKIYDLFR